MAGYRDLKVWQAGMRLAKRVYELSSTFPNDERFGLTSQMRRAAVSVPSNIAEGHARNTNSEMIRFCGISLGSLAEIETQLLLAADLGFADAREVDDLLTLTEEIGRMLHGLIRSNRSHK
jgi:four helix bundle protein